MITTCLSLLPGMLKRLRNLGLRLGRAIRDSGLGVAGLVILLAGCQAVPFPPAANPPVQADPPRLQVGDTWVYRHTDGFTRLPLGTLTHTITAISGDAVSVQVKAEDGRVVATDRYTRDWNWLDHPMTNIQRFTYAPPYAAFQFPLKVDKSWSQYMHATDTATGKTYDLARIDGRITSWQRVTVPAGAYDAILVRRNAYSGAPTFERSQEYITEDDWYAPAVNNVVFGSYRSLYKDKTQNGDEGGNSGWYDNTWTLVELVEYRPARK